MAILKLKRGQGDLYVVADTVDGLSQDYQFFDNQEVEVDEADATLILASYRGESFEKLEAATGILAQNKADLQAQYKALSGNDADGRWSVAKLQDAIAELTQSDDE